MTQSLLGTREGGGAVGRKPGRRDSQELQSLPRAVITWLIADMLYVQQFVT
jgi:hypothetical protein